MQRLKKTLAMLLFLSFVLFFVSDTASSLYSSAPTDFIASAVSTSQIDLSWSKGNSADTTYIERNTVVSWNRGEGTLVYNDTGTGFSDTGLNDNTRYYYQAWSYNATNNTFSSVDWTGLDFDGANDDVRIPDDNSLNFTSSFSVDMALLVEDTPADDKFDAIISKMTDGTTGWGVALYSDDGVVWEIHICVDGHNQSVGAASIPVNKWIYPTVVFNDTSDTMHVYINGNEVYSYSEPNIPSANTADVVIGECSYVGNDKTFDGKIDYIRLYNTALSEQDVKYNFYWKDSDCVSGGLVSWWRFNENTGTTAYDSQGSNDGTLEDGTQWVSGTKEVFNSAYNITYEKTLMIISDVYPVNNSVGVPLQPHVFATINHTLGSTMNISFYYGLSINNTNHVMKTFNNVGNNTFNALFLNAVNHSTWFYWRVMVDDGTNYVNKTYVFMTESRNMLIPNGFNSIPMVFGLCGVIMGFYAVVIHLKKKKMF